MTRKQAMKFAADWIAAWNRRDVDAVLAHYADDAVFRTPKGEIFAGTPVLRGKAALSDYWRRASAQIKHLEFTLDRAIWDPVACELVVFYRADLDGNCTHACEAMTFDQSGRQLSGEALYGARA